VVAAAAANVSSFWISPFINLDNSTNVLTGKTLYLTDEIFNYTSLYSGFNIMKPRNN
jgi:hypothetical protein